MSSHRLDASAPPQKSIARWAVAAGLAMIVVLLALKFVTGFPPYSGWRVSDGRVMETRIVVTGSRDASEAQPARIFYIGEAMVRYTADGRDYVAWLPATDRSDNREWLEFVLSRRKNDQAVVQWNPANPAKARATLHFRKN